MLIYMKNHRQEQILEILKEKGKVNVHNLSEYFSVTPKTIRRDLEFLEENGELVRIHGGAEMTKTDILRDKPFGVRLNIEAEKKEKIGKEAAMLLKVLLLIISLLILIIQIVCMLLQILSLL